MSVLNENTIIGASAAGEYEIDHSLRLHNRGGDGASTGKTLRRTPSVNSNRKTWTLSMWHKRGDLNHVQIQDLFFATGAGGGGDGVVRLRFERGLYATKDKLWLSLDGTAPVNAVTNQLFRDASAWMHIVLRFDTTQSTVTDRARIYINGEVISSTDYSHLWTSAWSNLAQNSEWAVNKAGWYESFAGTGSTSNPDNVLGGYLADIAFVDGQSLGPDSFGETGDYGEWKPIDVSALTFGTNGYHLDFADASAMGNDANGSNNFSVYNITANDQMLDSPTNNFCTFNPIDQRQSNPVIFREGNLKFTLVSGSQSRGTIPSTVDNKFYLEFCTPSDVSNTNVMHLGLTSPYIDINASGSVAAGTGGATVMTYFGGNDYWMAAVENGVDVGSLINVPGTKIAAGGIVGFAYDAATGKVWMSINNSWLKADGSFDGTNPLSSTNFIKQFSAGTQLTPATMPVGNFVGVLNCGQDSSFAGNKTPQGNADSNGIGDFYYQPPSGFLSLCTKSLPEPDLIPSEHFNTVTWTGNGSARSITTGVDTDLVWTKARNQTYDHNLFDSVRGALKKISSNSSVAESSMTNSVTAFNTDGFTVGDTAQVNLNGGTFVAWNWKLGGTAVSNTNGSATSQVSANVDAGISIATFTLPTTATTIGHGLSKAPELVIHKGRVSGSAWWTFHKDIGNTKAVRLDSTGAAGASTNFWNNTDPTSTVVTIGANSGNNNSWMMYCFHSVDGYSRVGSFVGNGSETGGPFVYCGFRPKFLLVKRATDVGSWFLFDTERSPYNVMNAKLSAENSGAEESDTSWNIDFLSNGFKLRSPHVYMNSGSNTHIFIAFAETPFKHSNSR
jgi:hypothetical protein